MNLEFFFSALTDVWLLGELLIAVLTQTREGEGKIQDRGTQIILWVVIVGSFKINDWLHRFSRSTCQGAIAGCGRRPWGS